MDTISYLLGKKASGGGGQEITSFLELNNAIKEFDDYLKKIPNNYDAYINENITIYTPDINLKHYMIQKNNSNKYRIVWANYLYAQIISSTTQGFKRGTFSSTTSESIALSQYNAQFGKDAYYIKSYYSNYFDTLEDLINALKNSSQDNITYTYYTSGATFNGIVDNNWKRPLTNIPLFDIDGNLILDGMVLSHNTTILEAQE